MTASFDFHFLKIHSLLSGGYSKFHFVTFRQGKDELFLTFQKLVSDLVDRKRISDFFVSDLAIHRLAPPCFPFPFHFPVPVL